VTKRSCNQPAIELNPDASIADSPIVNASQKGARSAAAIPTHRTTSILDRMMTTAAPPCIAWLHSKPRRFVVRSCAKRASILARLISANGPISDRAAPQAAGVLAVVKQGMRMFWTAIRVAPVPVLAQPPRPTSVRLRLELKRTALSFALHRPTPWLE
jgi:hypothetical protein